MLFCFCCFTSQFFMFCFCGFVLLFCAFCFCGFVSQLFCLFLSRCFLFCHFVCFLLVFAFLFYAGLFFWLFFCFFVVFFCFFCCCFVRDTALIKGIKYIFCSLIIATVNHVFQSLDKVIMEMSTCDEPRPHNGPSPIATVSGQRSVSVDPFYLP